MVAMVVTAELPILTADKVVALLAAALSTLAGSGVGIGWYLALAVVGFVPASELATTLVDRLVTWSFGPVALPGLALTDGVPTRSSTRSARSRTGAVAS